MLPKNKISVFIQLAGFIFFSILFYLSWHYYREIMSHFDAVFYSFRFMESGKLIQTSSRYGDYVPELLPFWAFKTGHSLKTVLILYSVSFIILHYIIFLITTLILKNNGAGIAIMLASCLSYYHTFYYLIVELNTSIILGVLLWALIHPENPWKTVMRKNFATAGALATIVYMSFLHPLGIFVIAFIIGMEMTGARRYKDLQLWIIIVLGLGWYFLKLDVLFKAQYDADQVMSFHEMIKNISGWKTWPSTHFVSGFTEIHFRSLKWLALLCLIFSLRKGIVFTLFLFSFVAGFTFIFLANFQHGTGAIVYENYYVMYGFFVGVALIFLFYHPRRRGLIMLLAIPLLWVGVKRIYMGHNLYSDRLHYIDRLVKDAHQKGEQKCIVDAKCYPYDYALTPWCFAFESLFCSSIPGPDSAVTVFIKDPADDKMCDTAQNKHNVLLGVKFSALWFTSNDMPQNYFKLPSAGYGYLTHSQEDSSFHQEIYSAQNIKMLPLKQDMHININDEVTSIPWEIVNTSGHIIPAIPRSKNPVLVTCKVFDKNGKFLFDGGKYPLEADVESNIPYGLPFYIPRMKGTFYVQPDIITDGIRSWNIASQQLKIIID